MAWSPEQDLRAPERSLARGAARASRKSSGYITASPSTRGPTQIRSNFVRPKVFGPQDFGPSHGPVVVSHTLCAHVRLYTG